MDMLVLRVDVPKEGFARKLGAHETVFTADDGTVGKVQQLVEILLRHERDLFESLTTHQTTLLKENQSPR